VSQLRPHSQATLAPACTAVLVPHGQRTTSRTARLLLPITQGTS
jgi:hypothetical protein